MLHSPCALNKCSILACIEAMDSSDKKCKLLMISHSCVFFFFFFNYHTPFVLVVSPGPIIHLFVPGKISHFKDHCTNCSCFVETTIYTWLITIFLLFVLWIWMFVQLLPFNIQVPKKCSYVLCPVIKWNERTDSCYNP